MKIMTICGLVINGWKSINTEQKICLVGIIIGMAAIVYAFEKFAISGYILTMFCILGYGLFKYFPILKKSEQSQKVMR